ncbi:MAG: copper resistance protein CopC [Meiothermus sp.]
MKKLLAALLLASGLALAHAELESSVPGVDSTVKTLPGTVAVNFTEAVEVKLSTFKIYPLGAAGNKAQLGAQAQTLVRQVLKAKNDADKRVDSGVKTAAKTAKSITLGLKPNLKPGAYVVMWQNLSTDGHTSSDFFVFTYKP